MNKSHNKSWMAIQYIITLIFSFIILKVNLLHFGEENYGIWIVLSAIWGFGVILDLGFGTALIKLVAENKENVLKLNYLISSSFIIFLFSGIIIFFTILILSEIIYFQNNNIIPSQFKDTAFVFFIILGVSFYFRYLSVFFKSIFEGYNNFVLYSKINIIYNTLIIIFVIIVSALDFSFIHLSWGYLISSFFLFVSCLFFFRRKYSTNKISLKYFRFAEIKNIYGYSISIQGATIFGSLIDPTIKFIIGNFLSTAFVSYYEVARKFAISISGLFISVFRTILPRASVLKNIKEYQSFLFGEGKNVSNFGIIYSGLMFGLLSIFFAVIIKLFFGYSEAIVLFLLLALPESINNFGYSIYNFFIGIGKAKFLAFIQLLNLVIINVSLIIGFLIFNSVLGLFGYFITIVLVNTLMFYFLKKIAKIEISDFLKETEIGKLIILNICLVIITILINLNEFNLFILMAILSIVSFLLFNKDFFSLSKLLLNRLAKQSYNEGI